jgi:hypothetical protein
MTHSQLRDKLNHEAWFRGRKTNRVREAAIEATIAYYAPSIWIIDYRRFKRLKLV